VVRVSPDETDVSDPWAAAQIHRIGSGFLKSDWYMGSVSPDRKPGIFAMSDPAAHASRRRLFARAFSQSALLQNWDGELRAKVHFPVGRIRDDASSAAEATGGVGSCQGADVLKWWTLLATDVIAHLAFGESFRALELGRQTPYTDAVQSALLGSVLRTKLPPVYYLVTWLPAWMVPTKLKALTQADAVVFEHGSMAINNMRYQTGGAPRNLFGQMAAAAEAQKEEGSSGTITDDDVRTEAGNLIVAGSDTTAVTLTYLVWAVLKQPALRQALEDEASHLSPTLDWEDLKSAPLLNSVIEETLRLYGAAPGALPRVVPPGGATFCGKHLSAGAVVTTQAYTIHRDANVFADPNR